MSRLKSMSQFSEAAAALLEEVMGLPGDENLAAELTDVLMKTAVLPAAITAAIMKPAGGETNEQRCDRVLERLLEEARRLIVESARSRAERN